jgi:ABC-type uncharacterized transport system permease subunit
MVKPYHILLGTCYTTFLVGMIAGAALARSPGLWIVLIVLTALAIGLVGYIATRKPRKKKLPTTRRTVR